jgi:hypothetical protein
LNPDQNNSLKRSLSHYSSLNSNTLPLVKQHNKHLIRSTSIEQIKPIVHYSTLRASQSNRNKNSKENSNRFDFNKDQLIMSRPLSTNGAYSLVDPNKIHLFVKVFQNFILKKENFKLNKNLLLLIINRLAKMESE